MGRLEERSDVFAAVCLRPRIDMRHPAGPREAAKDVSSMAVQARQALEWCLQQRGAGTALQPGRVRQIWRSRVWVVAELDLAGFGAGSAWTPGSRVITVLVRQGSLVEPWTFWVILGTEVFREDPTSLVRTSPHGDSHDRRVFETVYQFIQQQWSLQLGGSD